MSARNALRRAARWIRRARTLRKARLASLRPVDERLVEFSHQLRDRGQPYDTWRWTLPAPWRPGGPG